MQGKAFFARPPQILRVMGGALGGAWLTLDLPKVAHAQEARRAREAAGAAATSFLSQAELADVDAIAAQIIPTDATPGAREAGAIHRSSTVTTARSHDIPNLFVCDGSSLVTSGRGQPTLTIQALAFRAAEHIGTFARRNEI